METNEIDNMPGSSRDSSGVGSATPPTPSDSASPRIDLIALNPSSSSTPITTSKNNSVGNQLSDDRKRLWSNDSGFGSPSFLKWKAIDIRRAIENNFKPIEDSLTGFENSPCEDRLTKLKEYLTKCSVHESATGRFMCTCCKVLICTPCLFRTCSGPSTPSHRIIVHSTLTSRYSCVINTAKFWRLETTWLIDCVKQNLYYMLADSKKYDERSGTFLISNENSQKSGHIVCPGLEHCNVKYVHSFS